jgi:hypothetical protein
LFFLKEKKKETERQKEKKNFFNFFVLFERLIVVALAWHTCWEGRERGGK